MATATVTETQSSDTTDGPIAGNSSPTLDTIKLKNKRKKTAESGRKVSFTEDTVDNENLNKKKSKCCCIFEKQREFGESSTDESDDECDNCYGHKEGEHKHEARE